MRRNGLLFCLLPSVLAVASCSSPPPKEPAPTTSASSGCRIKVPESQDRPFIVEWDDARRAAFKQRVKSGVVVVRYDDCNLEILDRCTVTTSTYRWYPTPVKQDRISISTVEQLWANVPTGAGKLEERLGAGELMIEATRIGNWQVTERVSETSLRGPDCARATHIVASIATGAFEMRAGRGVLARRAANEEEVTHRPATFDGKFESCNDNAEERPPPDCSAPIRIELAKILAASHSCRPGDRMDCTQQCKNESEISCQRLADILVNDEDTERTSLYKRGCDRDDQRACNNFAVMLVRGVAIAHDLPRARQLLGRACDSGIAEACANAGIVLGRDEYMKPLKDPNAEVRLRQACTKGVALGCFEAGIRPGDDGAPPADAKELLTKACDLSSGPACAKLAAAQRKTDRALADKLDARACTLGVRASCAKRDPTKEPVERPWSELVLIPSP